MLILLTKMFKQVSGSCEEEARPWKSKTVTHPPIITIFCNDQLPAQSLQGQPTKRQAVRSKP